MEFIISKQNILRFYSDPEEYSGVKKIAGKVKNDIKLLTDVMPDDAENIEVLGEFAVIYGTLGKSSTIGQLSADGTIDVSGIKGKRECYSITLVKEPFRGVKSAVVIAGSEKRGTIYGLFRLSELLGISPLVNWSDAVPAKKESVVLTEKINTVSKEPSVRYRGFFINDEWPAFGNWAMKRFGGVNAKLYEHVFELLLRLKGNYLWPAMWASRFSVEGPGLESAELADELGVVMGMSHHEPCLRHGEEYKHLRGPDSEYGDAWNFRSNKEGITKFWDDGLKRSGTFENVITVGMRGEQDSKIMGEEATLKDNIELLRDVLKTQNELIKKNVNENLDEVPRMLALYKEVEEFFYGDENTPGLINSDELEGVILMLSDDNFGNLRTLPTEEMRDHKGGYGIYYHFDYHGWPVSFEWINSTYLPKVWEQMTTAYEFGIDQLWIVNVGDICTQEFPLSYFLDLAYDFEKWGTGAINRTFDYTREWVDTQFNGFVTDKDRSIIFDILNEYTRIASMRRPEAMNADIYHPANFRESDRMLERVEAVIQKTEDLRKRIPAGIMNAFYELVYYPAIGNMNLYKLQLLAGKNMYYARQGRVGANILSEKVGECLKRDKELVNEFHEIHNGKWYGMGLSEHIGFTNWNDEECMNPLQVTIKPFEGTRAVVSVSGKSPFTMGGDWTKKTLHIYDFMRPDIDTAGIEISSSGSEPAEFEISSDKDWLSFSKTRGSVRDTEIITVALDRSAKGDETEGHITVTVAGKSISVIVHAGTLPANLEPMTFVESDGYIAIEAEHFCTKGDTESAEFKCIEGYGKTVSAMKAFPVTGFFTPGKDAPYLEYRFIAQEEGKYDATLYTAPLNPVNYTSGIRYALDVNGGDIEEYSTVAKEHKVGDEQYAWGKGVLDNIRRNTVAITCRKGLNTLRIYAVTPGFVLERIVLHPSHYELPESYLGPVESYFKK